MTTVESSSARFNKISSNFITSEVHKSSPTIARLHELLHGHQIDAVCDVACGAGHLLLSFAHKASRLVAVDPAPAMLDAARQLATGQGVEIETVIAPAEHLPLPDMTFDATVSRLAPHHFADVRAAVREMARITKPGGFIGVIDLEGDPVPAYDDFNHRLEMLHDPTHVRSYTADEWRDIFERAGLTIHAFERGLSERPSGVPVARWCEIAASGAVAQREIERLLSEADLPMLQALGIRKDGDLFLMPIRTVLVLARRPA